MTKEEYIGTIIVKNIKVDIGLDDYSQSYFYEYDIDDKHFEKSCGTYNDEFIECICYDLDKKGAFISELGEEAWEEEIKSVENVYHSRMEKYLDDEELKEHYEDMLFHMKNDDYNLYNFKEMYKSLFGE